MDYACTVPKMHTFAISFRYHNYICCDLWWSFSFPWKKSFSELRSFFQISQQMWWFEYCTHWHHNDSSSLIYCEVPLRIMKVSGLNPTEIYHLGVQNHELNHWSNNCIIIPVCLHTSVWCTKCEEPSIQSMNVGVVLHLYGNRSCNLSKTTDTPPTIWGAEKPKNCKRWREKQLHDILNLSQRSIHTDDNQSVFYFLYSKNRKTIEIM